MAGTEISPFISTDDVDSQSEAFTQWLMNLRNNLASKIRISL